MDRGCAFLNIFIFILVLCFNLQRKETLLREYKHKNKANKLIDRRFGEYDTKMAPEDKILQRFAMERQVSDVTTWEDAPNVVSYHFDSVL